MGEKKGSRRAHELAKALSHPIRVEILEALRGRVASPVELSREMNQSVGVISYHAKTLVSCGYVELVHRKPARGSIEHFFGLAAAEMERRRLPDDEKERG